MSYYSGSVAAVSAVPVSYKMPVPSSRYSSSGNYRTSGSSLERPFYTSSSYLSRSYTSEYRTKYTSPARTSSVPSYTRTSSLSEDSGRFTGSSSSRERSETRDSAASSSVGSSGASSSLSLRQRDSGTLGRRYNSTSSVGLGLSPTELYNKYSPSAYLASGGSSERAARSVSCLEEKDSKTHYARGRAGEKLGTRPRLTAPGLPRGTKEDSSILSSSPLLTRSNTRIGNERGGLSGLRNIGNTCFMNSVIQCLSNTRLLLEYLLGESYAPDINVTVSSMKGALMKAFSTVIQELWREAEGTVVNTTSLKSQIQRFAPRFMGYSQQDAQEFLRYLLEGLHEDVNRITCKPKPILTEIDDSLSDQQKSSEAWKRYLRMDDSKIVDIFVGQLKSTLRCTVCGHCSVTFDPFWDLSLPIPSRTGQLRLQQCLESFTREEVLDGDEKPTCAKCQMRRKCTKSFAIQKFPKILVLHLKRFSPTERFRGKLSVTVDFPLSGLDLNAYAASRGQACIYNLYAVSNHSGTTYSGHYTAYCRHPYTGEWHEYNDSRVSSISPRSVVSSEAYVLFYELSGHSSHL